VIVIIGAGITGLCLAHELAARHADFIVVEATDRPGGAIRTLRQEGRILEAGPQRTRLTPALRSLVAELGMDDALLTAAPDLPLYVYRHGRLCRVPFSPGQLLATRLLSWRGKLRLLKEPFIAPAADDGTVADALTRRFGAEAYHAMLGPLFGGLYGSDPAEMPARYSLAPLLRDSGMEGRSLLLAALRGRRRRDPAPTASFRAGLETLTGALFQAHAAHIRLGSPAHSIRRAGAGLTVEMDGERIQASDVVITTPSADAASLLRRLAPDAATRLERLNINALALVFLQAEPPGRGLGYQVASGEGLETRGVTWNAALFGGEACDATGHPTRAPNGRAGVHTAFLGGSANPRLADMPDDWITQVAVNEFRTVTGREARPLAITRARMPAWDRSWTALDGLQLPDHLHLAANYESRVGIPGRIARARRLAEALATRAAADSHRTAP
jgi:protoporphyrinogen/coproporphyrinogen III oxidase